MARISSFIVTLLYTQLIFASSAFEDVSIYSPHRFGFNGEIKTIPLTYVQEGPRDKYFSLKKSVDIYPIEKQEMKFAKSTQYGTGEGKKWKPYPSYLQDKVKDRISTFGIARLTFDSYKEVCDDLGIESLTDFHVRLNPDDQTCRLGPRNAYYERVGHAGQGQIKICNQPEKDSSLLPVVKFFDIISHETSHGIFDALNPRFYGQDEDSPYSAFHEFFGDISSFFASVRLAKICKHEKEVVSFLKGSNLSFCLAPGFDAETPCLRNSADINESCEAHDHSTKFTSFYLDAMKKVFDSHPEKKRTAGNALWTTNFFQKLLVRSVTTIDSLESFYDMGEHIANQVPSLSDPTLEEDDEKLIQKVLLEELELKADLLQTCSLPKPITHEGHKGSNALFRGYPRTPSYPH